MNTPKEQLKALEMTCRQIIQTVEGTTEYVHYVDRCAQSRVCLQTALVECDHPVDDSAEFISDVIREQRDIIFCLAREVGLGSDTMLPPPSSSIKKAPDTLRSPVHDEVNWILDYEN